MKIEPLEHKHRYRFRVRAVNKIGKSDPCEMLGDDILIKDPWGKSKDYIYRMVKVQVQQYLTKPNHCI